MIPGGGNRCPIGSKATFDGFSDEGIAEDLKDPKGYRYVEGIP